MFDRYVTAVEAALDELVAHCNELVEPANERIEALSSAEHALRTVRDTQPDKTTTDAIQEAMDAMRVEAKTEAKEATRAYEAFEDAIARIESLVREAKYDADEPEEV